MLLTAFSLVTHVSETTGPPGRGYSHDRDSTGTRVR